MKMNNLRGGGGSSIYEKLKTTFSTFEKQVLFQNNHEKVLL